MAIFGEFTNQGRVVGGHLASGVVTMDSKGGGLAIAHPRNPFKKARLNTDTVAEWEELETKKGIASVVGQAAAAAALPGRIGKAVGAGLGAVGTAGHTLRVSWVDGNQSLLELPEKLYTIVAVLLADRRTITENPRPSAGDAEVKTPAVTDRVLDIASQFVRQRSGSTMDTTDPQVDIVEQIRQLAALHESGLITDEEFAAKKATLLDRL